MDTKSSGPLGVRLGGVLLYDLKGGFHLFAVLFGRKSSCLVVSNEVIIEESF